MELGKSTERTQRSSGRRAGAGSEPTGTDESELEKVQPPEGPDSAERIESAQTLTQIEHEYDRRATCLLNRSGVDPMDVWGLRPPEDPDRKRAAEVLCKNPYKGGLKALHDESEYRGTLSDRMLRPTCEWALANAGRDNPRGFADLYEYYKQQFDSESRIQRAAGSTEDPRGKAAEVLLGDPEKLQRQLESDRRRMVEIGCGPVNLDLLSAQSVELQLRASAQNLGFHSADAAAYHARKHPLDAKALLWDENDPIGSYHLSLQETLRRGRILPQEEGDVTDRARRIVFARRISLPGERASILWRAIVYVDRGGRATVATYGPEGAGGAQ